MNGIFEQGTKEGVRFQTSIGKVNIYDLWDLPLTSKIQGRSLDDLWKSLNKKAKETSEESLIVKTNKVDSILELKIAIVKRVIEVKLAEAEARKTRKERKEKKEIIMALIADKEHSEIASKSKEDLLKMLNELDSDN